MNDNKSENVGEDVNEVELLVRDSRGLVKGVDYKLKTTGYRKVIDWRAMILPEHLVFNKQYQKEIEDKYGKPLDQLSVTEVEDKYLLILLSGIKELADLRGYVSATPTLVKSERDHASATFSITWIGNFETNYRDVTRGDGAAATLDNTNGFGQIFLETIAINRAFVRAVRNFLGINIVGQDEVGGKFKTVKSDNNDTATFSSNQFLEQKCADKNISFDVFKARVIEGYKDKLKDKNPENWKNFADLKAIDASTMLEIIK